MKRESRSRPLFGLAVLLLVTMCACARETSAQTAAPAAAAEAQHARGMAVYERICKVCHEADDGLAPKFDRALLSVYPTAKAVFDFASTAMPFDKPGSLQPQEYWDALAYILRNLQFLPQGTALGPDNAESVRLR